MKRDVRRNRAAEEPVGPRDVVGADHDDARRLRRGLQRPDRGIGREVVRHRNRCDFLLDEVPRVVEHLLPGIQQCRDDLRANNKRILDYAAAGGTVVAQYNRNSTWTQYAPCNRLAFMSNNRASTLS